MPNETQKMEQVDTLCEAAFNKIPSFYDEQLWQKHIEWGSDREPFQFRYKVNNKEITTVGVSHTHKPESSTAKGIVKILSDYTNHTDTTKQIVMVEGFHDGNVRAKESFENSIETLGESGGIVFLAQKNNTPVISPEIPIAEAIKTLKEIFHPNEIALFYTLRDLNKGKTPQELAKIIYKYGNLSGSSWLPNQSEIATDQWINEVLTAGMKNLNETMINLTDSPLFDLENKELVLDNRVISTYISPGIESPETNLKLISQADSTERDKYLIRQIISEVNKNKEPLVFFGGTHILRIDPALKYIETSLS